MGPRAGIAEIQLPPVQPGSSIMPGKVNPSIAEMVNQVCYQVRGCDETIANACEGGQLELNVMMPVIAWNAIHETTILGNSMDALRLRCVDDIRADAKRARELLDRSTAVATALSPYIGYAATAEIAKEAVETGRSVADLARERGLIDARKLARILAPEAMTTPGVPGEEKTDAKREDTPSDTRGGAARRGARRRKRGRTAAGDSRAAVPARGSRAARRPGPRRVAETRADHGRARDRRRRGGR
jgi:aspartate ammonia-lyase